MKEENKEAIKFSEEQIIEMANTAEAVFRFITSMPEPIGKIVFKAVVDDAYEMAQLEDRQVALESLSKALLESANTNYYGDTKDIIDSEDYDFMNAASSYYYENPDRRQGLVEELKELLDARCRGCLPDRQDLVSRFPLYSLRWEEDVEEKEGLCARIDNILHEKLNEARLTEYPLESHCFYHIGYITSFINFIYVQMDSSDEVATAMFYRWFCKGEVLDYVIEAFARCESAAIKDRMWRIFTEACDKDSVLRDIFEERYNKEWRSARTVSFPCSADTRPMIAVLDPIPLKMGMHKNTDEYTAISELQYEDLYRMIGQFGNFKRLIRCSEEEFKRLFKGGHVKCHKPYVWLGKANELADFLVCCVGRTETLTETFVRDRLEPLFVDKDGERYKINTLKGSHVFKENKLRGVFNQCGIER